MIDWTRSLPAKLFRFAADVLNNIANMLDETGTTASNPSAYELQSTDAIMSVLKQRYPDAPAHWLRYVAARTSSEFVSTDATKSEKNVHGPLLSRPGDFASKPKEAPAIERVDAALMSHNKSDTLRRVHFSSSARLKKATHSEPLNHVANELPAAEPLLFRSEGLIGESMTGSDIKRINTVDTAHDKPARHRSLLQFRSPAKPKEVGHRESVTRPEIELPAAAFSKNLGNIVPGTLNRERDLKVNRSRQDAQPELVPAAPVFRPMQTAQSQSGTHSTLSLSTEHKNEELRLSLPKERSSVRPAPQFQPAQSISVARAGKKLELELITVPDARPHLESLRENSPDMHFEVPPWPDLPAEQVFTQTLPYSGLFSDDSEVRGRWNALPF